MDCKNKSGEFVKAKNPFPEMEKMVLEFWQKYNVFEMTLKKKGKLEPFVHVDGPPFATGSLHYGTVLVGTLKDIVCRFRTMQGYDVPRQMGWDCHGLPLEMQAEEILGIKTKDDIAKRLKEYCDTCRDIIDTCSTNWQPMVERIGRWVDMKNCYRTCDPAFMESVWWIFGELYKKGLIYQGYKVLPYSTACMTALSNFEAAQNYKDVEGKFAYVKFELVDEKACSMLVWTTTPWTLPTNMALCVNRAVEYTYVLEEKTGHTFVLATKLMHNVLLIDKKERFEDRYKIVKTCLGSDLINKQYTPMFKYYKPSDKMYKIVADDFVGDTTGTGIVHISPAFGADDYRVCVSEGIIGKNGENLICSLDGNGYFTKDVTHFSGRHFTTVEQNMFDMLKQMGSLYKSEKKTHSYPHCWRTDTPLIYKVVNGWFLDIEKIKPQLIANTKLTNWSPDHIKTNRFMNWIASSPDWCLSRSRFWGTPLPIWKSDAGDIKCVTSVEELYKLSGCEVSDLHRDCIDTIEFHINGKHYRRIEDVFDCWFESGAVPYAMHHYPFENREYVESMGPIDFICESVDQTRGWFYTLQVLATALFNRPAFKNVVIPGLLLADDGKKMSKSKKNYVEPALILNEYGADALRLYLLSSPVIKTENLKFVAKDIALNIRAVLLPLYSAYNFFNEYYTKYCKNTKTNLVKQYGMKYLIDKNSANDNMMDTWIVSKLNVFISDITTGMNEYKIYNIYTYIMEFIDMLTNRYIKLSRDCLKGANGDARWLESLTTLYMVLLNTVKLIGPFVPFITETIYGKLKQLETTEQPLSIHLCDTPLMIKQSDIATINSTKMDKLMMIIDGVKNIKSENKLSIKYPLVGITVYTEDSDNKELDKYIITQTGVLSVEYKNIADIMMKKAEGIAKMIGVKFKQNGKAVMSLLSNLSEVNINKFMQDEKLETEYGDVALTDATIRYVYKTATDRKDYLASGKDMKNTVLIIADTAKNEMTENIYYANLFTATVQRMRKLAKLHNWNKIKVYYYTESVELDKIVTAQKNGIQDKLTCKIEKNANKITDKIIIEDDKLLEAYKIHITIVAAE
ncbi:MAG: isoleucine--tRNA ligase, cytoplasmic [Faunusvirus sp.]|jgi:isoleucyl-tRNA synthetase|uniref:isoleucine--tRNA ligase n=1 Tax=Faunusvirus sp. TaxID=2487766 RepID=A0A3G5A0V8_9VIRU|nr:MAG: isoleucine--tRNA ligase, cytoplasmic [Faunusvirus sp.]